jgi:predicted heme/steroid binding protein
MVYCGKCGLPPEYCEFAGKQFDIDECKKWLQQTHASLFSLTYPVVESGEAAEGEESKE